jgi:hypothetical protein
MTPAAMAAYALEQIDQARAELNAVSNKTSRSTGQRFTGTAFSAVRNATANH